MSKIAVVSPSRQLTHQGTRTTREIATSTPLPPSRPRRGRHDRAGLGRAPDPRERPAGRVHPAPVGAVTGGAAFPCRSTTAADTQGAIGYMFQRALRNEFRKRGIDKHAATVITQTLVDKDDPAFEKPSKPIGSFMDQAMALEHRGRRLERRGGRGARLAAGRAVATPRQDRRVRGDRLAPPGGLHRGGVRRRRHPVIEKTATWWHRGRDRQGLRCLDPRAGPEGRPLRDHHPGRQGRPELRQAEPAAAGHDHAAEAKEYHAQGHFLAGSMGPKVQAIIWYLEGAARKRSFTSPRTSSAGSAARPAPGSSAESAGRATPRSLRLRGVESGRRPAGGRS